MALDEISGKIGSAWELHRKGDNAGAISAFQAVLRSDDTNVDAYYGLGLAQRANGDRAAAHESFARAKSLADQKLAELRAGSNANDLSTTKDDRYMMLGRMLQQRLDETA